MGRAARGEAAPAERRAADADRDAAIHVLNQALAWELLSPDEHAARVDAIRQAFTLPDLWEILDDLWIPRSLMPSEPGRRRRHAIFVASAATLLIVALLIGTLSAITVKPSSIPPSNFPPAFQQVRSPALSSPPSTDNPITATIAPPGPFASHDPADQCGYWPTGSSAGESNCYLVVRFTNTTNTAVSFSPLDLQITGTFQAMPPNADNMKPPCWHSVDVSQQQTLAADAEETVQLCYPVQPGFVPSQLVGTGSLTGFRSPQIRTGTVQDHWKRS